MIFADVLSKKITPQDCTTTQRKALQRTHRGHGMKRYFAAVEATTGRAVVLDGEHNEISVHDTYEAAAEAARTLNAK